jgi:aminoglycoside phosphotransferase (APT) family kinase protein
VHGNDWRLVEADPAPFLSTGLRDAAWLERRLPELVEAADRAPVQGDAVVHCDVRSDNLCIKDGRCVLVDWNHARLANPKYDVAFWAPCLALEHGPEPWTLGVDELAPHVAGFFAARAGLPRPAGAPTVRDFQREQARIALEWLESTTA